MSGRCLCLSARPSWLGTLAGGLWLLFFLVSAPSLAGGQSAPQPDTRVPRLEAHPREVPTIADVIYAPSAETISPSQVASPISNAAAVDAANATPKEANAAQEPLHANIRRAGYAFDKPDILLRQRLFGLAHGISLLTARCVAFPEQVKLVQPAFLVWHEKQANAVVQVMHDLAAYYFEAQASQATWADVAQALKLKTVIDQPLSEFELNAACTSLPQALKSPRYDLTTLLAKQPDIAMQVISGEISMPAEALPVKGPAASDNAGAIEPKAGKQPQGVTEQTQQAMPEKPAAPDANKTDNVSVDVNAGSLIITEPVVTSNNLIENPSNHAPESRAPFRH